MTAILVPGFFLCPGRGRPGRGVHRVSVPTGLTARHEWFEKTGWEVWESLPPNSCLCLHSAAHKQGSLSRDICWHLVLIPFWKKCSCPREECIAFCVALPKTELEATSSRQNPLTALIQFLKKISCRKVMEKPSQLHMAAWGFKASTTKGTSEGRAPSFHAG